MKVLFAVSNEEISESIVKKYQKEYKEIISYKNVYYFNAILKELQKDKTYDRIVISEDLEAFSHNQYDQIDKFIFDRLDSISDEAINISGEDIPIIIICADRRTKSEQMLSKLFGIGIYNALLGNDRSVEEVCKLINKPRVKREAKTYYKIESDEVKYQPENENDVSEVEIQNILSHFKRIGKNEDKYIESFNSIAEQYNDTQLKVICKFLPLNVRATLEERSPKYQKLIAYNQSVSNNLRKQKKKEEAAGTTEKLLKPKTNEAIMTKPVVIPSSVNISGKRKLSKKPITESKEEFKSNETGKLEELKNAKIKEAQEPVKIEAEVEEKPILKSTEIIEEPKEENIVKPVKRSRGRPRKQQPIEENIEEKPKRKRGRPRKQVETQSNVVLPGFEDENTTLETQKNTDINNYKDDSSSDNYNEDMFSNFETKGVLEDYENNMTLPGLEDENTDSKETEEISLPGLETEKQEDEIEIPGFGQDEDEDEFALPGFEPEKNLEEFNELDKQEKIRKAETYNTNNVSSPYDFQESNNYYQKNIKEDRDDIEKNIDISSLLTQNNKIACFVGTSKNGTSFIVNNVAKILSSRGIDVAILDTTKNRNAYYIYTKNEESLRQLSSECIDDLIRGVSKGIQAEKKLTVYTALEDERNLIENSGEILQTLVKNHTVILIDCDFDTPINYFRQAQEIYLVQSLDVLTIQPLTAFLRELKSKNILDEKKLRIVLNKVVKVRGVNEKAIIGGMAFYNDPSMSFMTELFDRNSIKYISIPFNEDVYSSYLGSLIDCNITLRGYPKNIMQALQELSNLVFSTNVAKPSAYKPPTAMNNGFSDSINSTLDQMKKY